MTGKIIFTGRVLANDYVSLREWILSIHPGLIGWAANNQDIKIVFNGNEYFIFKGDNALHIDDNTGFVIVATTDGKNLVAGKNPVYQIPGDQKIYFQNNFNDATNRVVVNSIREESMVLDKPFEIRRFFHNNRQLDYSMMSTLLKDYDNAYGAKRAPAPDLDWRDLNEINGDLKFEVLECEDASFVGEYKIDKTGGNGHQSYWFAGGEPNIATKHALFKLKKKQQDGTYAPTDYEVGCTASDGAGEGWWPEAITPATRKDHWVIRINGGASGVVSSCKFTRVVNPTNQVKFTKDNFLVKLEERILSWKMPQDGNKEFELGAVISGSVATGYKFLFSRNILNLVRQNLNGTTGNSLAITSEGAFYYAYSDKLQPDGTIYNPTDSYVGQPISNINWSKIKEIKFRVRGGQYALDLSTTNSQDGSTSIVGLKRENGVYKIKLYEINGSGASSSIGADWTTLPLNQMKEVATMISGRNAKYYMKIDSEDNHLWFALSGNSSVVNIRLIIDSFEFLYVE